MSTMLGHTRREMLRTAAAASGLVAANLGLAPLARAEVPAALRIRREIHGLAADGPDIAALMRGVAAMKARPASDPTSWLFQANIHGTDDPVPPEHAAVWNSCQHGSFFFLSWHRMYLFFFERILAAASGDPAFALPYWDYSAPARRSLPLIFREPAAATNPLFVARRRASVNAGSVLPASATGAGPALASTVFASPPGSGSSFGGQKLPGPAHFTGPHGLIESQPHDVIHVALGGDGWMSDPNVAARDPIFWLHHCNIDRLWAKWSASGGGRRNPASGPWATTRFTFFDERGQPVSLTGADIVDPERQLGYRYDDGLAQAASAGTESAENMETTASSLPERVIASSVGATESALALGPTEATVALRPTSPGGAETAAAPARATTLSFDDISYRRPVGLYYEVYVNKPKDAPFDPEGRYYAGNLSFFGLGHAHSAETPVTGARATLDVGTVLARQREAGLWSGEDLKVELHPQGAETATESAPAGPLATIGQIRLLGR